MYNVKPYYDTHGTVGGDAGNVMYRIRPLCQSTTGSTITDVTKMDLLSRQEALISNIEQQIQRVDEILTETKVSIHTSARCNSQGPSTTVSAPSAAKLEVNWPDTVRYPLDIAIYADPVRLPVTPWALRNLLGDAVMVRSHVLSTYKGAVPSIPNDNERTNRTNGKVKIIFTVIFCNTRQMHFMVDPVSQTAVRGEANLFRYVCRLFPIFPTLGVFEETLSDHYIDMICSGLVGAKSKDQQITLKLLGEQITKKGGRLVCDKLTPADFCLHAALQKTPSLALPGNAQTLQKKIAAVF